MSDRVVNDCHLDPERLRPFQECMETYGIGVETDDPHDPQGEWPHNCISTQTVAYSCGLISRADATVEHNHDAAELAQCWRLAHQASEIMDGIAVGFGSESEDYFRPFFVTAARDAPAPERLNEAVIRAAFGGTIYPVAEIVIEPLVPSANGWQRVAKREAETRQAWRNLINWFHSQPELKSPAFVSIGSDPLSDDNGGCVFPRLAIALTPAGSLVGICGYVVYT
ncbi:hypothetical protein [Almyronema epifaneia]|uniref:Uncharacterized protein n=1 Tax=Almyronema epifaneia S1 TaxID=2991925 RepID=A0ABW6IGY9_9CYAN